MAPKSPLLITRIWSPGRACRTMELDQGIEIGLHLGTAIHGSKDLIRIPAQVGAKAESLVCLLETGRKLGLHGALLHGV